MGRPKGEGSAVLEALFRGPAAADSLGDQDSDRQILRDLVARGLVRRWQEPKSLRPGRRRAFYELTAAGVAAAEALFSAAGRSVAESRPSKTRGGAGGVDARLRRSLEISAVASALRGSRKATLPRR
jgi:DNA-binding PadR family transcriptional regulator